MSVWIPVVLIVAGGLVLLVGELIGVFRDRPHDTITEGFRWANKQTHGLLAIPLVLGLVWLFTHLVFDWP